MEDSRVGMPTIHGMTINVEDQNMMIAFKFSSLNFQRRCNLLHNDQAMKYMGLLHNQMKSLRSGNEIHGVRQLEGPDLLDTSSNASEEKDSALTIAHIQRFRSFYILNG